MKSKLTSLASLEDVASSYINIGDVFKRRWTPNEGVTPKDGQADRTKMFVVVGVDEDYIYGGLLINSNPNRGEQAKNCDFLCEQHLIRHIDYEFLRYDSFIDCTQIKLIKKTEITKCLSAQVGCLNSVDIDEVFALLRKTESLSTKEKKRFGILK